MADYVLDASLGQVRTIRLGGKLGVKFGRVHRMAVANAAEAIRALSSQLRGFDVFLTKSKDMGLAYAVLYGKKNIGEEELHLPAGDNTIAIMPVIIGGKSPWVRIIIGAVLIVASLFIDPTGTTGAMIAGAMFSFGMAMVVGGVTQLLTPQPKGRSTEDKPENRPSYSFNGPVNTQAQGNPVPVLYGELIVGSAVASAGITAVDQAYIPDTTTPAGYAGGGGFGATFWHAYNNID